MNEKYTTIQAISEINKDRDKTFTDFSFEQLDLTYSLSSKVIMIVDSIGCIYSPLSDKYINVTWIEKKPKLYTFSEIAKLDQSFVKVVNLNEMINLKNHIELTVFLELREFLNIISFTFNTDTVKQILRFGEFIVK